MSIKKEKLRIVFALLEFQTAAEKLNKSFQETIVDCNDYILDDYPEGWSSFDDTTMEIKTWVQSTIKKISDRMNEED